jgi:uncharacterized cupredoxin-like copper-binding protein
MGDPQGGAYPAHRCVTPTTLSVPLVRVRLSDMGMTRMMGESAPLVAMRLRATPAVVAAGRVSLVVENLGWRTHELVVLPLHDGVIEGGRVPGPDGQIDESGGLGEASTSCGPDSGEGIATGSVGWTTINLRPGRYELVCNLKNHYANGMHQELEVR